MCTKQLITLAMTAFLAATSPAAKPKTPPPEQLASAPAAEADQPAPAEEGIRFQFEGESFSAVIGRFARMVNKPLIGEMEISGTLTFYDSKAYTYSEALETLNLILATRGYVLLETGRYLRLTKLDDVPQMSLPVITDPRQTTDIRPSEIVTVMIRLNVVDPSEANKAISPLISGFGTSTVLTKGKGLIITDRLSNIRRVQTLLEGLDARSTEDTELRSYPLKRASAASVANILKTLLGAQAPDKVTTTRAKKRTRKARAPKPSTGPRKATVTHDERTNTVLVVGTPEVLEMAAQIIRSLDEPESADGGDLRIYELKHAKAEELANVIRQALPKQTGPKPKKGKARTFTTGSVVPDPVSNRLIVSVPVEMVSKIEKLIRDLDEAASVQGTSKIFHLQVADAEQLAKILPKAVTTTDARGKSVTRLSVSADPRTNSLLVSGSIADVKTAETIITRLDEPVDTDRQIRVIRLAAGDANSIARSLERLFGQQVRGRRKGSQFSKFRAEGDSSSNSLIISAGSQDWPLVQEILGKLTDEVSAAEPTIRQIQLRYADATDLAGTLKLLFARQRRPARGKRSDQTVTVAASRQNNSLIVRAAPEDHQAILELAASLDVPQATEIKPVTMIQLTSANAEGLVKVLRGMLPATKRGQEPDVFVQADALTNTILLRAPQSERQMLEQMIATLDKSTQQKARETRIIRVANVSAAKLAKAVGRMYPATASGRSRRRAAAGDEQVTVAPAPGDKALIVDAPRDKIEQIAQLIATLDVDAAGEGTEVRTYDMSTRDAGQLARSLGRLFARRRGDERTPPRFEADTASNQLIVAAPADRFEEVEQVLESLKATAVPASQTKTFYLEYARADEVVSAVRTMLDEAPPSRRGGRGRRDDARVRIAAAPFANAVIVKAPPQTMQLAVQMIGDLDAEAVSAEPVVRTYVLSSGRVQAAAQMLREMFPSTRGRGRGRSPTRTPVVVTADEASGALVVSAAVDDHKLIAKAVEQINVAQAADQGIVRVYKIAHGDAQTMASALTRTLGDRSRQRRRRGGGPAGGDRLRISAETASNCIVVRAPEDEHRRIVELISQMDVPEAIERPIRTIQLTKADAGQIARALQRMFGGTARGRQTVTIEGDSTSGVLMVRADDEAFETIRQVAESLDAADVSARQTVIPLAHGQASVLGPALERAFAPPRGKRTGADDLVRVVAEPISNSLIVSANEKNLQKLQSLLSRLDTPEGANEGVVKIYKIVHGEARTMASALNDALRRPTGGRGRRRSQQPDRGPRITADTSSNCLVVRADEQEHERIAKLVGELDVTGEQQKPVRLIPLANAEAAKLAQTLQRMFGAQRRGRRSRAPGVAIEADSAAGALVVRADEETFSQIRQAAEMLDVPAAAGDQTVIPVKHAEATPLATILARAFAPKRGQRLSPEDQVTVVAEPNTNSLVVSASAANLQKIHLLLAKLDTAEAVGTRTELLLLANSRAKDLAEALGKLAGASGRGRGRRAAVQTAPVVVSADEGSNALILSGPAQEVENLMKMALQLDSASVSRAPEVFVIQLSNGQAGEVAETVRSIYQQQADHARRNRQSIEPLAVSADDRANAIILATTKQMYEQVAQWIAQVEKMKPIRGAPRVIKLEHADPAEVEEAIQQLFGRGGGGGSTGGAPPRRSSARNRRRPALRSTTDSNIKTTVLPRQRAVLVDATDEEYEQILKLVQTLEAAAKQAAKEVKIFTLTNASNARVAAALNSMYRAMRGDDPRDEVTVTALEKTNAVVVAAAPEKMEEVARLIEQLDRKDVAPQLEFRIYPLQHATPSKVLPMLQKMLKQVQDFRPDQIVDVQADDRTRSIIVTARADVFDPINTIIKTLDQAPAYVEAEVLIIPLARADAEQLAKVLNEMLRPSASGQVTPEALALQEQIRRLRVRSTLKQDIPELDLTKPIKISADPAKPQGSNSIILSSTPENLKALRAIVEIMDTVPIAAGVKVRLVVLANADAESVTKILKEVFDQGKSLAGKPGSSVAGAAEPTNLAGRALVNPPNISADLRTNTLIISGQEESIALAEIIARDLDRERGKVVTQVRLFKLAEADATKMAPILQAVFAEGPAEPGAEGLRTHVTRLRTALAEGREHTTDAAKARAVLTIQADPQTNILIVAARSDVMPLIADVIKTMDIPGAGSMNTVRIFPLVRADATRLSEVINKLYTGPNAQYVRDEDKPTVAVDTRTNALVISASGKTFDLLAMLLERLDEHLPVELHEIRLLPLANSDAAALAPTLQTIMDSRVQRQQSLGVADAEALRVVIVPDPRSNSLIVAGSPESHQIVKDLAERLDTAAPALGGRVQIFPLKFANVGAIGTMLNDLFQQRYQSARLAEIQRLKPIIVSDLRTNSLLVAAGVDDTNIIKSLLRKLDKELLDPAVQLVVIPLKFNDAGIVAQMIQTIFAARLQSMTLPGQTPVPQDRVDVATDSLTNSLIVSASKENLSLIRGLLGKVDVELPDETGIVRMYFLKNSDAQRVANMIKSLIAQGLYKPGVVDAPGSPRLVAREKVAVEVDLRTNVLIVSASKENFAVIEEIINRIDVSEDFGALGDIRLYKLKHADATKIAPTLQQFFAAKLAAEQTTGGSARSLPVSILADARSNTLLVAGSRESFAAIEQMIERLDSQDATRITEIRVFELNQADATELAGILTDILTAKPPAVAEEDADRQTLLQFVTRGTDGSLVITQGMREGLLVIPDIRNNSLVVSAPVANMPMLATLIKAMDSTAPRSATIRVFQLINADASRMADVLKQLFRLEGDTASARSVQYTLTASQPTTSGDSPASTTVGTDEQYALTVTVDVRTNSLLVGGTRHQVEMASKVIEKLDSSPAQERLAKVYRLRNARATDIEQAMRSFLDQERDRLLATLGSDGVGAAQRLLEREVAVVAVAAEGEADKSNTLLLSASPRYFKIVEQMINELDQPPPQVRVQVMLAEVGLDDKTELGIDWNFAGTFDDSDYTVGTNFGVAAKTTGFSISITGGDLSFFLRALQAQGRLEIISRPQILTCDNQQGEIKIGQRVPFIRESRITESGTTLNTIQYEDVGINLLVTPRINPDGFVRLEVEPEISQLSDSTVQVSEGVNAIVVNSRSAKTTVTVQDGHTIIIGGLITTKEENREDKVPFFGDLPLLGNLFKSVKLTKERAELLIILTPHILRNTAEADALSRGEIDRLKAQGKTVRQYQQSANWLRLLDAASPVKCYESDFQEQLKQYNADEGLPVPLEDMPESSLKDFAPKQRARE